MPKENSLIRFHSGQYQFKVPFATYADFEAILQEEERHQVTDTAIATRSTTKLINFHIPSGFCTYSTCAYGKVKDPLKLYWGKDCVEVFCQDIQEEAKRLCHMFPKMPMKH